MLQGHQLFLGRLPDDAMLTEDRFSAIGLQIDGTLTAIYYFRDPLRDDAELAMQKLHEAGIETFLLSGDRASVTQALAQQLPITRYQGEMLPQEKQAYIQQLQAEQGASVLMVGDGLNDAPSLSTASVSMSPASAVDITQNSADILFQNESLLSVIESWRMAKFSTKLVKQNFSLAALYNCLAIPLALAGLVTPLVAAVAMSGSSLIVIANSFRTNLTKPLEEKE